MSVKKVSRLKRAKRARKKIASLGSARLSVHRTPRHIYAQVISECGKKVLASASSVEKTFREDSTGNIKTAESIGVLIAQRAIDAGVKDIAFDRSGFKYHGRVKALAEKARENGLNF